MRRVLIDHARRVACAKRGAGRLVEFDEACTLGQERATERVPLAAALVALARADERQSFVVQMRYFDGLTVEEIAEALEVHPDSVTRDWRRAQVFLRRQLEER
jgi:RNA polymerase sigma factor (sigma-70 family)